MTSASKRAVDPGIINIRAAIDDDDYDQSDDYPRTISQIIQQPKRANSNSRKQNIQEAGLLPPELYKNPRVSGKSSQMIDEIKFKDPLSRKTKYRLMQTYQDYTVSSALATLIHYVLGRNMKATVYPVTREQLKTQEEVDKRLNEIVAEFSLGPTSIKDLQNFIDMVDHNCRLYEQHLPEAMAQSIVFGRAALWIVRANNTIQQDEMLSKWGFKEGVPVALRPLDSLNLGQVIVDTKSWEPKKIEYEGNLGSIDDISRQRTQMEVIDIEDLIYFTRDDYNIIPDSYNYGFTQLLDAIPISENKRRLTKKVLAEINNNQWAGLNIYEIAGMSTKDMQAFADTLRPGRSKITNQPLKVHNVNPQFDMTGNLEQLKQLHLNLLMALKVPSFLMNFEQITNRATTEAILQAWQQTKLEAERNWLRTVLWKYWYKPLIEFYFPDKRFLYMKMEILEEFQNIEFSSLFEKSISVNNLYAARIITVREARELLTLPPFPPEEGPEALQQQDLVEKLVNENPDMVEPLQRIGQTQTQEERKLAQMEGSNSNNQLLVKPGAKIQNPETILNRIRNKGKVRR